MSACQRTAAVTIMRLLACTGEATELSAESSSEEEKEEKLHEQRKLWKKQRKEDKALLQAAVALARKRKTGNGANGGSKISFLRKTLNGLSRHLGNSNNNTAKPSRRVNAMPQGRQASRPAGCKPPSPLDNTNGNAHIVSQRRPKPRSSSDLGMRIILALMEDGRNASATKNETRLPQYSGDQLTAQEAEGVRRLLRRLSEIADSETREANGGCGGMDEVAFRVLEGAHQQTKTVEASTSVAVVAASRSWCGKSCAATVIANPTISTELKSETDSGIDGLMALANAVVTISKPVPDEVALTPAVSIPTTQAVPRRLARYRHGFRPYGRQGGTRPSASRAAAAATAAAAAAAVAAATANRRNICYCCGQPVMTQYHTPIYCCREQSYSHAATAGASKTVAG